MSGAKREKPELVSPAGSVEAAYAALAWGADAVYAGLGRFSARAGAPNLTVDELDELVGYAHSLPPARRVLVALNTLVLDDELDDVVTTLARLESLCVDALVVQDLGVARVVRRHFPSLRLHASTQMAVHGRAGVEAAARMGFARVILARELTLDEVRDCAAVGAPEVEVFVHGALCYSYSGLCLFSSHALGRSGNRGRCAQPCRSAFMATPAGHGPEAGSGSSFSMRDLALVDWVERLADAGVAALKIEGRMRSPLYVAAATDLYRRLLDGPPAPDERARAEDDLKTIFSRPWTDLQLGGRGDDAVTDPDVTGHRGARIGEVETVVMPGGEKRAFLRFRTSRRLEVRDGLQVEPPAPERPFGFPVERMRVVIATRRRKAKDVFEAPAGSTVEVELPVEYPLIPPGTDVYCSASQEVKQRFRWSRPAPGRHRARRPADFEVELGPAGVAVTGRVDASPVGGADWERAEASADASVVARVEVAEALETANDPARTEAAARKAFAKLGGTPFELRQLEVSNPGGLFAPVSVLNSARRLAAEALGSALSDTTAARVDAVKRAVAARAASDAARQERFLWSVKTDRIAHLASFEAEDWRDVSEATIDISRGPLEELEAGLAGLARQLGRERVRLALPVITRAWEEPDLRGRIRRLRDAGWRRWEIANPSGWTFLRIDPAAPGDDVDLATDWPLYVANREAARALLDAGATRFTLSPEDGLGNWRGLLDEFGSRATVIVHQDTPLFISEMHVPGPAGDEGTRLVSSFGDRLRALDAGGRTVVVGEGPLCLSERLDDLADAGAVSLRVDFVWREYAPADARARWRAVRSGTAIPGARAANFDRGLA
ncbi:MAG: peptidase U32 family protein [Planctomycetota bacterium]|jgi:putative protease